MAPRIAMPSAAEIPNPQDRHDMEMYKAGQMNRAIPDLNRDMFLFGTLGSLAVLAGSGFVGQALSKAEKIKDSTEKYGTLGLGVATLAVGAGLLYVGARSLVRRVSYSRQINRVRSGKSALAAELAHEAA